MSHRPVRLAAAVDLINGDITLSYNMSALARRLYVLIVLCSDRTAEANKTAQRWSVQNSPVLKRLSKHWIKYMAILLGFERVHWERSERPRSLLLGTQMYSCRRNLQIRVMSWDDRARLTAK